MGEIDLWTLVKIGRKIEATATRRHGEEKAQEYLAIYRHAVRKVTGIHYDDMGDHVGMCQWATRE